LGRKGGRARRLKDIYTMLAMIPFLLRVASLINSHHQRCVARQPGAQICSQHLFNLHHRCAHSASGFRQRIISFSRRREVGGIGHTVLEIRGCSVQAIRGICRIFLNEVKKFSLKRPERIFFCMAFFDASGTFGPQKKKWWLFFFVIVANNSAHSCYKVQIYDLPS
jgi:hypothetical protein